MSSTALRFIDGTTFDVAVGTCRGCFMSEIASRLPEALAPVYDDGELVVRQDAEWPVPAFYIVSIHEHVGAVDLLELDLFQRFTATLHRVRKAMRDLLGVERAQMYHEEKIAKPHLHMWLLPLWPDVMERHCLNPRIYEGSIKPYLDCFEYEAELPRILEFNRTIRRDLAISA